jgi:hypothetical protein
MKHSGEISSVIDWAENRGYAVVISRDGDDSIDSSSKIIEINSNNSEQTQLYVLLHECGHALIFTNKSGFGVEGVLDMYSESSSIYKVFRVIEEIEAWKRGLSLASRLGIKIDRVKWDRYVARAIKKYMHWALN